MAAPTKDGVLVPFSELSVATCTELLVLQENMSDAKKCVYLIKYISMCAAFCTNKIPDESMMTLSEQQIEMIVESMKKV
jgi:hypothetical protein